MCSASHRKADTKRNLARLSLSACLCVLSSLSRASAVFVVEHGGLQIRFPEDARQAHSSGFDMYLANFGAPKYGGELSGKLVYVDRDHGHDFECHPSCVYACQNFADATPSFHLQREDANWIMLVDRGPQEDDTAACKFTQKVMNAQNAGAQGVIVVNFEDRATTMQAPDEADEDPSSVDLRNITIPAGFITKSDGQVLKDLMDQSKGEAHETFVVMDWNDVLPRASKVSWEFWTNSNDQCGSTCDTQQAFIREFAPVARELEGNWTQFTPHYIIWVCPRAYRSSPECQSQCIHNGRYCTPDPDGDLDNGYKGRDVVQENLRQLCVYKLANESGRPWVWWDYTTRFADECKMSDNNYNEECAERVFSELAGDDWSNKDALRRCIGDINADTNNDMMQAEMASQRGSSQEGEVFILPTVRINHAQYRGKLAYSEVLKAICAGFTKNNEPDVCLRVAEDDCREGSVGDRECKASKDGKTQCKNTFAGYECECGRGFLPHTDKDGKETCLNVNECLSVDKATLDPACTCERCACKDTYGSYECIKDIPDDCARDNECWSGEFKVDGKQQSFSACQDNLHAIQDKASKGESVTDMAAHTCGCGACFTQYEENGKMECVPKCDLNFCDQVTGVCNVPPPKSGGTPVWAVLSIVFGSFILVGLAGYGIYRYRIRGEMHQEIRDIMAQYMPLENQSGVEAHNGGDGPNRFDGV